MYELLQKESLIITLKQMYWFIGKGKRNLAGFGNYVCLHVFYIYNARVYKLWLQTLGWMAVVGLPKDRVPSGPSLLQIHLLINGSDKTRSAHRHDLLGYQIWIRLLTGPTLPLSFP